LAALAIYKGHRVIGLALSFASIAMLVALLAHHATSTLALCLLQRGGLIAAGLGFLLNLRFGLHPAHYGVALAGSVTGAAISMRQTWCTLRRVIPASAARYWACTCTPGPSWPSFA
jgi:disulfide bond formation protein DsbB